MTEHRETPRLHTSGLNVRVGLQFVIWGGCGGQILDALRKLLEGENDAGVGVLDLGRQPGDTTVS